MRNSKRYIRLGKQRVPAFATRVLQMVGRALGRPRRDSGPACYMPFEMKVCGVISLTALICKPITSLLRSPIHCERNKHGH